MRVSTEIRELDRAPLCLRERLEGRADRAALDVLLGRECGVLVTGLKLRHLERRGPERRLATKDVDGTVMDDREEPGPGIPALAAIARRAAPGGEEGILYDVLGALALPEDPVGQGVRQASVAVIERGERAQIPGGQRAQEGVVGRLLVRHSENCTVGGQGWMKGEKKRPERPASVPYRSFEVLRPGRGADPRYPLGPPLMLSPVALPGTGALDGISDPFPLADPSGRRESCGLRSAAAMRLSTKSPWEEPTLSTSCAAFSTARPRSVNRSRGAAPPPTPIPCAIGHRSHPR